MLTEAERYAEYLICQKRGHEPSGYVTASIPPKQQCRWCQTFYWLERPIQRESNVPRAQLTPEQEEVVQAPGRDGRECRPIA